MGQFVVSKFTPRFTLRKLRRVDVDGEQDVQGARAGAASAGAPPEPSIYIESLAADTGKSSS